MLTVITRQNLLAEKTRFLISVGGIALSVFLISFLLSLFQGWQQSVGRFVEDVEADIWVAREGTTDFLNAASILPADMQSELAALPDVEDVDALIVRPMNFSAEGKKEGAHLVGYESDGAGGPTNVRDGGKETPGLNEVIVEKAYAKKMSIGVGDTLEGSGQALDVVGISTGGDFVFSQTVFVSMETAREMLAMTELSTFFLVQAAQGTDLEELSTAGRDGDRPQFI